MFALSQLVGRSKAKPAAAAPAVAPVTSAVVPPGAKLPALHGQKAVVRLLRLLQRQGQPLTLSRGGQMAAFRLTALNAERPHSGELLWTSKAQPAQPLLRLEPQTAAADSFACEVGQSCRVEFDYQSITHYGTVCLARRESEDEQVVHWFHLPPTIYQNQRRSAFRVQITPSDGVELRAAGTTYAVLNLSAGGIALYVNANYQQSVGAKFGPLQLMLPDATLEAEAEVRHVSRLGNGRRICGLRLHFADRHSMDQLHRFVLRKQLGMLQARP